AVQGAEQVSPDYLLMLKGVVTLSDANQAFYAAQIEAAAQAYEEALFPPFFDTLKKYVEMENATFACPGHQGGEFFRRHPAGRQFYDFFGANIFRSD
ncbi:ornithine decarboxylase, partial [Salmonella enterica subsp. enterica]